MPARVNCENRCSDMNFDIFWESSYHNCFVYYIVHKLLLHRVGHLFLLVVVRGNPVGPPAL